MSVNAIAYDPTQRSIHERTFHAITFEVIAITITAPSAAFIMGTSVTQMGALTIIFATIAMLCNIAFNYGFDIAQRRMGFTRTTKIRLLHAVLFEISLIAVLVPIASWWLMISLTEAFLLDFGFTLFFLPYTFIFNYIYDHVHKTLFMRKIMHK